MRRRHLTTEDGRGPRSGTGVQVVPALCGASPVLCVESRRFLPHKSAATRSTADGVADGPDQAPDPLPGDGRPAGTAALYRHPDLLPGALHRVLADTDIGVIGVPYDGGVTNRTGARHGPRAVRDQSSLLRRLHRHRLAPFDMARVRDLGDCWIEQPYTLEGSLGEIAAYYRPSSRPRSCRCRSAATIRSACRSCARSRPIGPVGMIHIDAHCDTGDDYLGSRFHHGAPFRRAVEEGLLDPKRVIQIGIRGTTNDPDMWGFSTRSGMRVLPMEEFHDKGWRYAAEEARRVAGGGPTYLTFDIDSLDPSQAPGTGTPEAGGFTALEAMRLLRALRGRRFRRRRSGGGGAAVRCRDADLVQRRLDPVRNSLSAG